MNKIILLKPFKQKENNQKIRLVLLTIPTERAGIWWNFHNLQIRACGKISSILLFSLILQQMLIFLFQLKCNIYSKMAQNPFFDKNKLVEGVSPKGSSETRS